MIGSEKLNDKQMILIGVLVVIFIAFLVVVNLLDNKSLNGIKAKKVGNGQHGTARWATKSEIKRTFIPLQFEPEMWRKGQNLPTVQGTVVGCRTHGKKTVAIVDDGDVHTLMIGAAGVGKTAYFLYPNIELACASGMSFISTDTKGDVARNYGTIAKKYYGYNVSVLDLRNPTRSDENNILHLVNKYMDMYLADKSNLSAKAKAEKYAKITAKTIINIGGGDSHSYGQNAFFYDAAEGLLASVILLLAEFGEKNERHIVSVFKLIQDLLTIGRKNWLIGQMLFLIISALTFLVGVIISTIISAAGHIKWSAQWSATVTDYSRLFPENADSFGAGLIPENLYYQYVPLRSAANSAAFMLLLLVLCGLVMLVFAELGKKLIGIGIDVFLQVAGGAAIYLETKLRWAFPCCNAIVKTHFTKFFRRQIYEISYSYIYFVVLIVILVALAFVLLKNADFITSEEDR